MALVNRPDDQSDPESPVTSELVSTEDTSSTASETGSMAVSDEDPETLHGKQCHEMSRDAGCFDLPAPSIQHETFSTTAVVRKKILESQTLAVKYFGLKVTTNMPAHNSLAKTNWSKPKVEYSPIFEGEEI